MNSLLEKFVGHWLGEEVIHPSKWGEGGPAEAEVSAAFSCDGKILLQNYSATRNQKKWLEAHAVFHAAESGLQLFWFDSLGFVPQSPAEGYLEGDQIIFTRTSPRGQTQHIYRWTDDNSYTMKLQTSFDQGQSWIAVMDGVYRRK